MPKKTLKTSDEMRVLLEDMIETLDKIAYGQINRRTSRHVQSQLNQVIETLVPMVAHASILYRQDDQTRGIDQPVSVKQRILFNTWADATDILADALQARDLCESLFPASEAKA